MILQVQTVDLSEAGQFDFWLTQPSDSRLLIDIFCPPTARCWGNITEVTVCVAKSPPRDPIPVKGEFSRSRRSTNPAAFDYPSERKSLDFKETLCLLAFSAGIAQTSLKRKIEMLFMAKCERGEGQSSRMPPIVPR